MRVLIAPQEYKGSLSAEAAAQSIARGLRRALPHAEVELLPLADGGPGTVDALVRSTGGEVREADVRDPAGRPVLAAWGMLPDGTAIVEIAAASGLTLLAPAERDPRRTST
ncbi:MAG: glycerate kinase, partial [Chloroflexi bacterium]|nr:glycerate kinase [Chloroflexota bacterium]